MEFDEFDPCSCATRGIKKICKNCEKCSVDYNNTKKAYCYDVSWLRMMLFGPRHVKPSDTCKNIVLRKQSIRSR